jgi:transcriptional regulator with XRE-family HTH domain
MDMMNDKEKVRRAFAKRFRQALAELGYSPTEQKRLSTLFGVSGQAVRKWVEGEALPTSSRMPKVAAVLGVRRAWLQDGEGSMRPVVGRVENQGDRAEEVSLSASEVGLVRVFRKLNLEQQDAIHKLVNLIVG